MVPQSEYDAPAKTPYTVRVSARARHVRLVVTADRGLEVVVPRGFSRRRIPPLVERKRDWIARAAARLEAARRRLEADPPRLPERIALPALGEEWQVEYHPAGVRRPAVSRQAGVAGKAAGRRPVTTVRERPGNRLVVTGASDEFEACRQALSRWLRRRARRTLVPRLEELARLHGLPYESVSIRRQRTRWGSCSRRKSISLNARLLFLPAGAVDYVLLHELCHTVELNHSPRFWALVAKCDPECAVRKKLVQSAARSLPTWLDHEPGELDT